MLSVTTNIRRLFAFVLALGVLVPPATAFAGDGHHGQHGHRGHYGHHGRHRQHGGIHLGIQFGHHGRHAGDHHSYRHHRGYPYYGYRYRSPYYSVYGGVPVYRYRDDAAKEPAADEAKFDRHVRDPDRSGLALGAAWNLLATDRPVDALHEFGRQARSNPDNGMPKVGYALASAMTGDLTRSVRAMRRALRVDPHSLQYVTIDQRLRPKIEHLAHQYEQTLDNRTRNLDAAFMVASMHYLLGNTDKAHHAIERANRDGDHSASAENLRQLIEAAVAATATHASGSDRAPVEQTTQDAAANDNARDY